MIVCLCVCVCVCVCYSYAVRIWKRLNFTSARAHTHTQTHTDGRQLLCLKRFHVKDEQVSKPRTALFWAITQRVVVIPYQRFGTAYRSHLQWSSSYC